MQYAESSSINKKRNYNQEERRLEKYHRFRNTTAFLYAGFNARKKLKI